MGPGCLTYLQGVLIALGLRTTPGHVGAALKVAQDQLPDDVLMGLLEQLLEQPQCGDADLGPEGVSRTPLPAPASGCAWGLLTQMRTVPLEKGSPVPGRFWREWESVGLGIRSLADSIINLM